jgi:hypothetical protein
MTEETTTVVTDNGSGPVGTTGLFEEQATQRKVESAMDHLSVALFADAIGVITLSSLAALTSPESIYVRPEKGRTHRCNFTPT